MVHEEVHQRASQKEKVGRERQEPGQVPPVLRDEPEKPCRSDGEQGHLDEAP
jgi:hypothetical protein